MSEKRNPVYFLLLIASLIFVLTALGYAIVPILEDKAREAGNPPPQSAWRDSLREDGWRWLLYEVGVMIVLAFISMWLDRHRRLQNEHISTKISDNNSDSDTKN